MSPYSSLYVAMSSTRSPREFLPELLGIVFDFIKHDPRTLSSSSRVSKSWLAPAQSRLFDTIHLRYEDGDSRRDFFTFPTFLRTNTHLCPYPRSLMIWGEGIYDNPTPELSSLVLVLRLLPRLQTLHLDSLAFIDSPIPTLRDSELLTLDRLVIECFGRTDDSLADLLNLLNRSRKRNWTCSRKKQNH